MLSVGRNIRLVASLTKVQHHFSLTNAFQLVFSGKAGAYCKVDFLSAKFSRSRTISYQSLLLRLRYTGSWKPFHDPQKFAFDSIKTTHYVIIDNGKMAFMAKVHLCAMFLV